MNKRKRYIRHRQRRSAGIWNVLGNAFKTAAPIIGNAAKSIGTNVIKPELNYAAKNADIWAPPIMNAGSQLIASKLRQKAQKELKKSEAKHNELIGKLDEEEKEFTDEELKKLLRELQGSKSGSGFTPPNIVQGLRQTVRGTGIIRL